MKCIACGSETLGLIKVFAGSNPLGWSPVGGEKDIFGNYKRLRPLLAHACADCGSVNWNIRIDKPVDPIENAKALDELASEEFVPDPGEQSTAYTRDEELN